MFIPLIGSIGFQEILVIALVVLLLFGGKKIPELMKGLGKGVRSFKDGLNDNSDDNSTESQKHDESHSEGSRNNRIDETRNSNPDGSSRDN